MDVDPEEGRRIGSLNIRRQGDGMSVEGDAIGFRRQVDRFLTDPEKPLILALSRPDERKNILTLIEAYGESATLKNTANLLIVAGSRDEFAPPDLIKPLLTNWNRYAELEIIDGADHFYTGCQNDLEAILDDLL